MRALLEKPLAYRLFSWLVGDARAREWHVRDSVRAKPGDRVLDIGCGPGDMLEHLPEIEYYGFDINPEYIESARRRFGGNAHFECVRVSEARAHVGSLGTFDLALATGVLHHLDDAEAVELLRMAHAALRPGGRLVTLDGCYVDGQSPIARYLLSKDRGQYVRTEEEYMRLARAVFGNVRIRTRNDLLRIPYSHAAMECAR